MSVTELFVSDSRSGGGRYEPYPSHRHAEPPVYRGAVAAPISERERQPPPRDDHASEQVKDLLELYFRDPLAFDQYAKTYYYGERAERERSRVYYERRPVEVYVLVSLSILSYFIAHVIEYDCFSELKNLSRFIAIIRCFVR